MPYTLKATGLATRAKAVIAVDQDGATIKEFVNGYTNGAGLAVHANVTIGTASFRGSGTKPYFETLSSSGTPQGVALTTNINLTTRTDSIGSSIICVMAGFSGFSGSQSSILVPYHLQSTATADSDPMSLRLAASTTPFKAAMNVDGFDRATSTDTIPSDGTTKFTVAGQYMNSGTQYGIAAGGQTLYIPEASAGSTGAFVPATPSGGGFQGGGIRSLVGVGGNYQPSNHATTPSAAVGRAAPGKYLMVVVLDTLATLPELQALHDDPFGVMFDTATAPVINTHPQSTSVVEGDTANFSVSATLSSGGGALAYQWKFNGSNVGTNSSSYARTGTTMADDNGQVVVVVSDNNGDVTSDPATLTVTSSVVKGIRITFGVTPAGATTGVTAMWWDAWPPTGNPVQQIATEAFDGAGQIEWALTSTTLAVGGVGTLALVKAGASAAQDQGFIGRFAVQDIGT